MYSFLLEKSCNINQLVRHALYDSNTKHINRPFSYSGKESESNDVMMQFEEFSNVHNSDRTSNATRSNLAYKTV